MYDNKPEVAMESASGGILAPKMDEMPRFTASPREKAGALAMYFAAYLYACVWIPGRADERVAISCFTLCFVALTELLHWNRPRSRENWVWLGCIALLLLGILRPDGLRVWGDLTWLFLHVFAVWWVLSRSESLLEGKSGHLAPLDAMDGFILFPFKHFFLRIRTVWYTLTRIRRRNKSWKIETVISTALATVAAAGLLALAASLLMRADTLFASVLEHFTAWFQIKPDAAAVLRFLLSLPVGTYLFGLIAGTGREDHEALRERGAIFCRWLETLRKVPGRAWLILTALFCLLYAVFFAVQFRYLFGAFSRALPQGFSVAQYARQGFFELCKVMCVNFALLWLVTRSSRENGKALRRLCLLLLAESLLFAVVACSKLLLYIDCFGFTPKRLQSTWLVCVLACGCVCSAVSLVTQKKSFRFWMIFSAVTLSLLTLV